ncbi:MAG: hypothetical protein ACYSTJ_04235 [Planctomycetota bacterium]
MITHIVFTKNRPLQLEGYLRSLHKHLPAHLLQSWILYKPELFDQEYQRLFKNYPGCTVINESDFFSDFLTLLNEVTTKYILFGIDDVVYFDSVDFEVVDETFARFSENIFGFSLRFGGNSMQAGDEPISENTISGQTVYAVNWTQGRTPATRYPFELCATIYPTSLIKKIIRSAVSNNPIIKKVFAPSSTLIKGLAKVVSTRSVLKSFGYFFNPNTLESWNCRWCQKNSYKLPGWLYFQKACAIAIQVNTVNTSTYNENEGSVDHSVASLAEKYRQGFRLDLDFITENKPLQTHCGSEYFKLVKTKGTQESQTISKWK